MSKIQGLGIIKLYPDSAPVGVKAAASAVSVAAASFGIYRTLSAFFKATSLAAQLGLSIANGALILAGVDNMIRCAEAVAEIAKPAPAPLSPALIGLRRSLGFNPSPQPEKMVGQDHWLDRKYADSYARWWDVPDTVKSWE